MEFYKVGKIVNTHGVRGELKVIALTDFPEIRFAKGSLLYCFPPDGKQSIPVKVASSRYHKGTYIIRFSEMDNINQVEAFKGGTLKISEDQLVQLEEGQYYYHEIVGCSVYAENGDMLGTVKEVLTPGANDVWVVDRTNGKELLIPVIDECVLRVDVADKRIEIRLMEGLLDL